MAQAYSTESANSSILKASPRTNLLNGGALLLFMLVVATVSLYQQTPPAAVSTGAPLAEFSSGRAMPQLKAISQKSHPLGSLAHEEVRDYIVSTLRAEGLSPEIQKTVGLNQEWDGPVRAATVENIVVRLKGTENTKAILLVGHYDSVPTGPGASDDGAAVAAMLETVRALQTGAPLKNDVILLFSDGEEAGLLGADAFVNQHPWAKDVGLVLNFEARGNSGPSMMFETSNRNGWLIREFAKATPAPRAQSLAYEIYRLLPNDTDLTVFKQAGYPALNFAYINGISHYHTQLDSFSQIDERSLQHQGSYALALTRHFGNLNLGETPETNAVYFDLFGEVVVHYSYAWVLPLTGIALLLFAGVLYIGVRNGRLNFKGVALGFINVLLSLLASALAGTLIWRMIDKLQPVSGIKPSGETYYPGLFLIGFVALAVAISTTLFVLFRKRASAENLAVGGLLWWMLLLLLTSFYLPGASYLLTWPLLFSLIGLGVRLSLRKDAAASFKGWAMLCLCAIPGIILLSPTIEQVFVGLTLNWIGLVMALVVLLLGLLIPHLDLMTAVNKWSLTLAATLIFAGCVVAGSLASGNDANHPKLDSIFYGLNADSGAAVWASVDRKADAWTSQFFNADVAEGVLPEFFSTNSTGKYLKSPAPVEALAAPNIEVIEDSSQDGVRKLRLHITSPRHANLLSLYVDSKAEVLRATVNGRPIDDQQTSVALKRARQWSLRYYSVPPEGIEVSAEIKTAEPLKLRVVDQSYGLPELQGKSVTARPDNIIPAPISITDSSFVSKSFTF
ncbi:MAG TPA: M20/M25/M40 family metallo-hydrolase [Pyrinomonadaceae bacterium]